jgi:hypothetical protein
MKTAAYVILRIPKIKDVNSGLDLNINIQSLKPVNSNTTSNLEIFAGQYLESSYILNKNIAQFSNST